MPPKIPTEKLSHSICFGKKGDLDDKKRGTDRNLSLLTEGDLPCTKVTKLWKWKNP